MKFAFLTTLLCSSIGFAASFTNLTDEDFQKISKEFSANFTHHSVQGANTLGKVFGFEFGLLGGLTNSPDSDAVAKASTPPSTLPNLANGGLLLSVSVPLGFTGEIVTVPSTSTGDGTFKTMSFGLKWTSNDAFPVLPINMALRLTSSSSDFSFTQTASGVTSTVTNTNKSTGLTLLLSPKLPVVEPYVGIGTLSASNTLSVNGTAIFDPSFTAAQSAEATPKSTLILAGVTANLLFFRIGAEYFSAFGTSGYTAKLAFGF